MMESILTESYWREMVSAGEMIRGYSEIALRMLWKVITDARMFSRITCGGIELKREMTPAERITGFEREIASLSDELKRTRTKSARAAINTRLSYLRKRLSQARYEIKYRRTPKHLEYHREYMRAWRSKHKAEKRGTAAQA